MNPARGADWHPRAPRMLLAATAAINATSRAAVPGGVAAAGGGFRWRLAGVERVAVLHNPTRHRRPAWFRPF